METTYSLPRKWPFWRDMFFWAFVLLVIAETIYAIGASKESNPLDFTNPLVIILWLAVFLLQVPAIWTAIDTYRWDVPNRNIYIMMVLFAPIWGLGWYLMHRLRFIEEAIQIQKENLEKQKRAR